MLLVVALSIAGALGGQGGRPDRGAVSVVAADVDYDAGGATAVRVHLSNRREVPVSATLVVSVSTGTGVTTSVTATRLLPSGTTTVTVELDHAVPAGRLVGVTAWVAPAGTGGSARGRQAAGRETVASGASLPDGESVVELFDGR